MDEQNEDVEIYYDNLLLKNGVYDRLSDVVVQIVEKY